ncbi:MAG TPA: CheR family methyltransferase [Anaerolineales bacterium]|nr:CheR family methyltransferase [Anaerolineales bacterium]
MPKMASNNKKSKRPSKANPKTQTQDPEAIAPAEPTNRPKSLTIVGIGASAGGLAALTALFSALPSNTGMAFVVVTHLHPEHESHLPELLQKHTQMPTQQVVGRIKVEPNHVYVIPPNRSIMMADSHLDTAEFTEPHGQRTPIDHFFRSLAQGHSESIAVILSGGGTDGSVGIKDVKEQGGLILVQHPADAEYDSMPRAAIGTGLADLVLPAAQLAEKLAEYPQHRAKLPHDAGQLSEPEAETLQRILALVHARTGHDFNQYKRTTILRRVERRMQLNGLVTLDAYLSFLRRNAGEAQAMFNDILIGVTSFFRDVEAWSALEENVIPALFHQKEESREIRVWSIGCATGEEAYSLAILLFEQAARLDVRPHIQIFASDLDDGSIANARNGLYPAAIEADVSSERLERFFTREGEYYRVNRELRDAVLFSNHNLLRDPPFARQSLIVCRNVLIYLQRSVQERVFDIFYYALKPEGYLFLGSSESAEQLPDLFAVIHKSHRIYRTRPWKGERPHIPALSPMHRRGTESMQPSGVLPFSLRFTEEGGFVHEQHQRSLEAYGPPSVLVDERYQILHVSETAGRFLQQPKGPITGDLLKLVSQELQTEVRNALFHAFEKKRAFVGRLVSIQVGGQPRRVLVSARPHVDAEKQSAENQSAEKQALVLFLEDESSEPIETLETRLPRDHAEWENMITQLQEEVQRLREQLQITAEEYDSSNEEMKAANEEMQSINEEYRSTTEELETSKEELQSVNEELQTVNNEMRNKLDEVTKAHQELENLMGASEIPTLFLDRELRIQRFTAGISELFNILPSDRGRPISDLTHKLGYNRFTEDAEQVLRKLMLVEREVQLENGSEFVIRLRPYRTVDDRIEGVVVSFIDITKLKAVEQELMRVQQALEASALERAHALDEATQKLRQTRDLFENFFDTNPVPTSITTLEEGTFLRVNEAYRRYYNLKDHDVLGHTSGELNLPIPPHMRPALVSRLQKDGPIRNIEMETKLRSGETRNILASLQTVMVDDQTALMLAFIDITERVRAERDIRSAATSMSMTEQMERQRISQILHDDLQQNIFAVKVQLSFLADALKKNDTQAAQTDLDQLDEWLAETIAITRQLSIDLSPPILSGEGLPEQFLWLASQMGKQYNLDVTVKPNGVNAVFAEDVRTVVFQSVRELLFNVVKHSGELKASVDLEQWDDHMSIMVSDEGKGFDPKEMDRWAAHGLRKMRDRLLLVGCTIEIESEPDKGTRITIEAPTIEPT